MKKHNKILVIAILLILIVVMGVGGLKIYSSYRNTLRRISIIENEIILLKRGRESTTRVNWEDGSFNYLAIGNSITRHGLADYWWDADNGMAATRDEHDYVHLVTKYLKEKEGVVQVESVGFSIWETLFTDRAETLNIIDPYLSENLNLVTIQLGENVKELSTFDTDFEYLIAYIKNHCQNSRILVIGDFWEYKDRDRIKMIVAEKCKVDYISLNEIKDNAEYQAGMGAMVFGDDGIEHQINHSGVAAHPGDKGMAFIANKVIEVLSNK